MEREIFITYHQHHHHWIFIGRLLLAEHQPLATNSWIILQNVKSLTIKTRFKQFFECLCLSCPQVVGRKQVSCSWVDIAEGTFARHRAFTLLVGWQEGHVPCKNLSVGDLTGARCKWITCSSCHLQHLCHLLAAVECRIVRHSGTGLFVFTGDQRLDPFVKWPVLPDITKWSRCSILTLAKPQNLFHWL